MSFAADRTDLDVSAGATASSGERNLRRYSPWLIKVRVPNVDMTLYLQLPLSRLSNCGARKPMRLKCWFHICYLDDDLEVRRGLNRACWQPRSASHVTLPDKQQVNWAVRDMGYIFLQNRKILTYSIIIEKFYSSRVFCLGQYGVCE